MDAIFGRANFRNEIIWCYRGGGVPRKDFARKHDTIFRYSKTGTYSFNLDEVRVPYSDSVMESHPSRYDKSYRPGKVYSGYAPNPKGKHPEDWWELQPIMPSSGERLGYPTQKPLKLLDRIIRASSNEGDVILDPFCGCGTTLHAAQALDRRWLGIDICLKACGVIEERLRRTLRQPMVGHPVHRASSHRGPRSQAGRARPVPIRDMGGCPEPVHGAEPRTAT